MNPETFFDKFGLLADTPNGVQKLRELILQLAVQGKLVPQDPNDEPTKFNHQQTSFTLPYGWLMCKLGDVLDVQNGFAFKSILFTELSEGIPLIRIRNLKNSNTSVYYTGEYPKEFLVNIGDYLIGMDGDFEIHKWNGPVGLLNQRVCRLKNFSQDVDPEYIRYSIQEKLDDIHANTSFVTVKHLSSKKIKAICLPMPPLKEQHRIVAKVDKLMALCDELEARQQKKQETCLRLNSAALDKLLTAHEPAEFTNHWQRVCDNFDLLYDNPETVGELRKAILQLAVQGKLVRQNENDEPAAVLLEKIRAEKERLVKDGVIKKVKTLAKVDYNEIHFDVPYGWEWVKGGDLFTFITSGSRGWAKYYSNQGAIFLRIGNLDYNSITLDLSKIQRVEPPKGAEGTRTKVKTDDILVSITGDTGMVALIQENLEDAYINQHIALGRPSTKLNAKYVALFLTSPVALTQLQEAQRGIKNSLGLDDIRNILTPLPPLSEQHRIVAKVDQLMALCDDLEAKLNQSQTDAKLMEAVVAGLVGV